MDNLLSYVSIGVMILISMICMVAIIINSIRLQNCALQEAQKKREGPWIDRIWELLKNTAPIFFFKFYIQEVDKYGYKHEARTFRQKPMVDQQTPIL